MPKNPETFSVFEYLYRDGANFKEWGSILLSGTATEEGAAELKTCLSWGIHFVAEQVTVPPLYGPLLKLNGGPTPDDHAFHEFSALRVATEEERVSMRRWGELSELMARFRKSKGRWKCRLSPLCDA